MHSVFFTHPHLMIQRPDATANTVDVPSERQPLGTRDIMRSAVKIRSSDPRVNREQYTLRDTVHVLTTLTGKSPLILQLELQRIATRAHLQNTALSAAFDGSITIVVSPTEKFDETMAPPDV